MDSTAPPAGRDSLPPWTFLAPLPFLLLGSCAIYLWVHWSNIPPQFPIHWGVHGPNGWSHRTFLGVYSPLIFGAGLATLLIAVGLMGYYGSRRSRQGEIMLRSMVGVGCFLGLIFSGVGLLPLGMPAGILIAAALLSGLGLLGILLATASGDDGDSAPSAPDECWKAGALDIYYNPSDPALFVPKRIGWGYTFNFANRFSWVILATLLGGVGVLIAFLTWAMHAR